MSKSADITRMFEAIRDDFGTLDILVNNAGVAVFQMIEDLTKEAFHLRQSFMTDDILITAATSWGWGQAA
jgi:NAD(P)-dependent dehydrogenase (short-subunit alcohol dehydrogenase family)